MKAIGYVRVSTEEQKKSGLSMDLQEKKIKQYADLQDMELIDIKIDGGLSAKNLSRTGITDIINLVKKKQIDAIIIYKLDRLTRSLKDLNYLIELFNKYNVSLCSVKDSLDTKTASGRMVINILGTISQWERETIGERTSEALQELKSKNKRYGQLPFGKQLDADNKTLIDNPEEQNILKMITRLKKKGYSLRQIAEGLNNKGHSTRKGTEFKKQYIYSILKNAA